MKYDFYITGTIGEPYDWWTGQRGTTTDDVRQFLKANKDKEVTIAVSSPGGYLNAGITICELIASHGKCNMVIVGMTASAATVLCMKAKSVKIAKGSMMLIHNSSYTLELWTSANKQDVDSIIDSFKKKRSELDTFDKAIASIYASRNGKSIEENMAMMDKEKWMLAEEALDFGIVDAVVDDEESASQAKAVKNACASRSGLTAHYCLPDFPVNEEEKNSLWRRMRESLSAVTHAMNAIEPANRQQDKHNPDNMKKFILNLVCACLNLTELAANEKGEVTLTGEQLQLLEDALKEKDSRITALEGKLKEAEDASSVSEQSRAQTEESLKNLTEEFEKFKNEAGDHSPTHVPASESAPVTSASMFESIKDLL